MKRYNVIVQPPAMADIDAAYLYIREHAPRAAEKWLRGIQKTIDGLQFFPNAHALAREHKEFREPIRQTTYGRGTGVYRIIFVVRGDDVRVLHVRHGARQAMPDRELGL